MECPNCKADVRKTDKRCHDCGEDLKQPAGDVAKLTADLATLKTENETLTAKVATLEKELKDARKLLP